MPPNFVPRALGTNIGIGSKRSHKIGIKIVINEIKRREKVARRKNKQLLCGLINMHESRLSVRHIGP